jgi:hypothetical protein
VIRGYPGRIVLAAMGLAGATLAHAVSYLLAHRDGHERAAVLADSGHVYWDTLVHLATFALVAALFGQVAVVLRGKSRGCRAERERNLWFDLALAQCSIFIVVECLERLLSGTGGPWHEPAFWIALPLQVAVAAAAALLLKVAALAAVTVARRMRRVLAVDPVTLVPATRNRGLFTQSVLSHARIRAPPGTVTT